MAVLGALQFISIRGTNSVNLRVILSSDKRVINKWVWLNNILIIARMGIKHMIVRAVLFIELRDVSVFDLQGHCLCISFQFSDSAISDH